MKRRNQKPEWLNKKIDYRLMHATESAFSGLNVRTICHKARCPNISECFNRGTATFLILGDVCTRNCGFCNVEKGVPKNIDSGESDSILEAVKRTNLRYVVLTSVTRDDLEDGGAGAFADAVGKIKDHDTSVKVEVLTPDFRGRESALKTVVGAMPDVFGHNIETVPSLYYIRAGAEYKRSLNVLERVKEISPGIYTKSSIMLGLGEAESEAVGVFRDLRDVNCDFLSIGQYLQPGRDNIPVKDYIAPESFDAYKEIALEMGFLHVESGVYVRSSYLADKYAG